MQDLISRQVAIEALRKYIAVNKNPNHDARIWEEGMNCALTVIGALPSAQTEIIHCKECKYGVQDKDEWWYCREFGCQVGEENGSGFCAEAERRTDE